MNVLDPPILVDNQSELLPFLSAEDAVSQDIRVEFICGIVYASVSCYSGSIG